MPSVVSVKRGEREGWLGKSLTMRLCHVSRPVWCRVSRIHELRLLIVAQFVLVGIHSVESGLKRPRNEI